MEGQALVDPALPRYAGERQTGVRFAAVLQAVAEDGRTRADGEALVVEDATAVTLLLTAATDVRHPGFLAEAERAATAAAAKPFARLRADHVADYRRLFHPRHAYGAGGFVIHHNTDLWGDAVPIDGVVWGVWPMGGAWLTLHVWEHYDFTRDRDSCATRAYPTLKEAVAIPARLHGRRRAGPSRHRAVAVAENRYRLPDGDSGALCMGPTWIPKLRTRSSAA